MEKEKKKEKKLKSMGSSVDKRDKRLICFRCGAEGHIAPNCTKKATNGVHEIGAVHDMINKSDSIYLKAHKIIPIFDTGAEESYITKTLALKLNLMIKELQHPKVRYTCLKQPFKINHIAVTKFTYEGREYDEIFNLLPMRKDECMILGKKWIAEVVSKTDAKPDNKIEDNFEVLKEKLFQGRQGGVTLDYECSIETKPDERITEGCSIIPQAL